MVVRNESVRLSLDDAGFTSGVAKAAAQVALLDKRLNDLDGSHVKTTASSSGLEKQITKTSQSMDRDGASIDRLSGRLALFAQAASVLGPALLPIGAVAVPAITGLATAGTAAAVAGGSLIVAMQGVGDAVKAVNEQAINPSAANLEKMREAMSKLGPDAREFVREFQAFRPALADIRDSAAAGWFPGLIESLDDFEQIAPRVADLFERIGRAGGEMVADTAESFNSDRWSPFFDFVAAELPSALTSLGAIVGDLTHGAAEMWMAFDPANDQFLGWLEGVAEGFDNWSSSAAGRQDIAAFLDYVNETGPQVEEFFLALVSALTQVSQAAAPLAGPVLSSLTAVSKAIAAIADSDLGTPIFTGIAALSLYNRALATTAALQRTAFVTGAKGGATGASATGALGAGFAAQVATSRSALGGLRKDIALVGTTYATAGATTARESQRMSAAYKSAGANIKTLGASVAGAALPLAGIAIGFEILTRMTNDLDKSAENLVETLASPNIATGFEGLLAAADPVFRQLGVNFENLMAQYKQGVDTFGMSPSSYIDAEGNTTGSEETAALTELLATAEKIAAVGPALAEALNLDIGPIDGSLESFRELDGVVAAARPNMESLRYSVDDLALAQRVAAGEANFYEIAQASVLPTLDEMVAQISGAETATTGFSGVMREAAAAAREERDALNDATNAMRDKTNAALGAFGAETRYREALKSAAAQAKESNAGIRGSSEAAIKNRQELEALAGAWNGHSDAVKNNVKRNREARASYVELAVGMGVPIKQAEKMAERFLQIPRKTVAKVEAETKQAEEDAARTKALLKTLGDMRPKPDVDLLTSPFDSAFNATKAKIRDLDGDVATVTTRMVTAYSTIGSKVAGLNPFGSADGSTVPDDGGGYRDFLDYRLAPREEVISNRNGQADRNRPLLKGVNANLPPDRLARLVGLANGGTAGGAPWGMSASGNGPWSDPFKHAVRGADKLADSFLYATKGVKAELTVREKLLTKALDRDKQEADSQRERLKSLKAEQKSLMEAVKSSFKVSAGSNLGGVDLSTFGSGFTDALNAYVAKNLDTLGSADGDTRRSAFMATLSQEQISGYSVQGQIADTRQAGQDAAAFEKALKEAVKNGLDKTGGLFQQIATSGNLAFLQAFAGSPDLINQFQSAQGKTNKQVRSLGQYAGDAAFGKAIDRQTEITRESVKEARETNQALKRVEHRLQQLEKAASETGPDRTARGVSKAINGAVAAGQRKGG